MSWIPHPVSLEGSSVRLEPLTYEHIPSLLDAAAHSEIWQYLPFDGTNREAFEAELKNAVLKRRAGEQYPFAVRRLADGAIVGHTRFFDIFPEHKKLEIGWTWYRPDVWGSGINIECKLLLLTYCFEVLMTNRVQLKTRDVNARSAAAIRKIGAQLEGTLRKDRMLWDGTTRDSLLFSILDDDWPEVKERLVSLTSRA
jgi:RimJ/RimL family protein N-acetyltransferase